MPRSSHERSSASFAPAPWLRVAGVVACFLPALGCDVYIEGSSTSGDASSSSDDEGGASTSGSTTGGLETTDASGAASTSGIGSTGDTTGDTTGVPGECALPPGSPPSIEIGGELLVPIDITSVDASIVFDLTEQSARGTAEMAFIVGPEGGRPIFDLRQPITAVSLDGVALGPDAAAAFVPGYYASERMRSVDVALEPCTKHKLRLEYDVGISDAECSTFPYHYGQSMTWFDYANDFRAGCLIEQWIPANLPHDEFDADVEIELEQTQVPHALVTNGTTEVLGDNHWQIDFPSRFTSMSPMMVVIPEVELEHSSTQLMLPDGHTITVDIYKTTDLDVPLADIEARTIESLRETNLELGEYIHGDRYVLIASPYSHEMEYAGATSTSYEAIPHEVFHSWIGRGLRPLTHRDAWLDEGWTYFYNEAEFQESLLTPQSPPVTLAPNNPWLRRTEAESYEVGAAVWATLANALGLDELRGILRDFYMQNAGEFVTTEQLERFVYCETNAELVRFTFHRFVYGRIGALPEVPADYCS